MIIISRTPEHGSLYFDKKFDIIYQLPYHPPAADAMAPPYIAVFAIASLFGAGYGSSAPAEHFLVVDAILAILMLLATKLHKSRLCKLLNRGEKFRLSTMDIHMLCTVYMLAERDVNRLFGKVYRYTGPCYLMSIASVIFTIFFEGGWNSIALGIMALEIGLYSSFYANSAQRKRAIKVINTYLCKRMEDSEKNHDLV